MNQADLDRFEAALAIKLPEPYPEWALRLPRRGKEDESWQSAFTNIKAILRANRRLRKHGWYGLEWHSHLICIGEIEGNHFFIDLLNPVDLFYAQHDGDPSYDPGDYSQCRISSLDEFCGRASAPKGFKRAWAGGEPESEDAVVIRRLDCPTIDEVEAEIRQLDGVAHIEIMLHFDPEGAFLDQADLEIVGACGRYYTKALVRGESFTFYDPTAPSTSVQLIPSIPEATYCGSRICHDLDLVLHATRYFHETGELSPSYPWKPVADNCE